MHKTYYIYVLIPTFNCENELDSTIESVLNQTFSKERLRIVAMDNCSTDGTYNKLLDYAVKYPKNISVFRSKEILTKARLLKHLVTMLKYTKIDYSVFLSPGSTICPDFLQNATILMRLSGCGLLVSEADIVDDGIKKSQTPIFNGNCILKSQLHLSCFFSAGIGNKIFAMYAHLPFNAGTRLVSVEHCKYLHDWFALSNYFYHYGCDCIYTTQKAGCIKDDFIEKPVDKLMDKAFWVKRLMFTTESNVSTVLDAERTDNETKVIYRCLSVNALQYAVKQMKVGKKDIARDCLLFSEMIFLDIVKDPLYSLVQRAINDEVSTYNIDMKCFQKTSLIPIECFSF